LKTRPDEIPISSGFVMGNRAVRRDEPGLEAARRNNLLRIHAGDRDGRARSAPMVKKGSVPEIALISGAARKLSSGHGGYEISVPMPASPIVAHVGTVPAGLPFASSNCVRAWVLWPPP